MPVKELPIFSYYDKQRFTQFSPMDAANWYLIDAPSGKRKKAMYPTMGRKHFNRNGLPILVFGTQPRKLFKSISFLYVIVGSSIYQVDINFNVRLLVTPEFTEVGVLLNFAYLPTVQTGTSGETQPVYCGFVDGTNMYVYDENTDTFSVVTDTNAPPNPAYIAAYGNRFVVSSLNSTQFSLTQINLGNPFSASAVFTVAEAAVFAQESGVIRQMAVLHNILYIFTDYTTGNWSNTVSTFTTVVQGVQTTTTFPWKKNTSYDFDYGIADPDSLDVDFGMLVWLGQNRNGLVTFLSSNGQSPQPISTQAVNTLIQAIATNAGTAALLTLDTVGFLYQYEDTKFYRVSIGPYISYKTLDRISYSECLEYNFETQSWHRCIELNGQRSLVEQHEFFANKHIVTCETQTALYDMAGIYYFNETQDPSVPGGFLANPFRYEAITSIIYEQDYSEFLTKYIQIDFVWGNGTASFSTGPYANTVFMVTEASTVDNPVYITAEDGVTYIIEEGTNTAIADSATYNELFNPHIELYWSDDGGVSFNSADVLEFSQLGIYSWRMRWYQGGASRNRVYKLICVSIAPIVILGGTQLVERASGGAN